MQNITTVAKETVGQLPFTPHEVMGNQHDIDMRRIHLNRALKLGNLYRQKVTITYQLRTGEAQRVQTTVWAVTENHVMLKGGLNIPINAISSVEL